MNPLTIRPDRLARLRNICLALAEATEKEAWGDPTWRVRDRIFAMQKGNFEAGRPSVWLKAADDAQSLLVQADPGLFFVPPYVGHKGWVGIYLDAGRINWALIANLIEESYQLIAPKRLSMGAAPRHDLRPRSKLVKAAKAAQAARATQRTGRDARPSDGESLKRPLHPIPPFVRSALTEHGLTAAFRRRPPYQRNDYIGWITLAKREATQRKRLAQMLDELARGRLYMNMAWHPGSKERLPSARAKKKAPARAAG